MQRLLHKYARFFSNPRNIQKLTSTDITKTLVTGKKRQLYSKTSIHIMCVCCFFYFLKVQFRLNFDCTCRFLSSPGLKIKVSQLFKFLSDVVDVSCWRHVSQGMGHGLCRAKPAAGHRRTCESPCEERRREQRPTRRQAGAASEEGVADLALFPLLPSPPLARGSSSALPSSRAQLAQPPLRPLALPSTSGGRGGKEKNGAKTRGGKRMRESSGGEGLSRGAGDAGRGKYDAWRRRGSDKERRKGDDRGGREREGRGGASVSLALTLSFSCEALARCLGLRRSYEKGRR